LAELGANVNAREEGIAPMHLAASRGHVDTIRELAKLGGNLNAMDGIRTTSMYHAYKHGQCLSVEVLKELGASADEPWLNVRKYRQGVASFST
jgi:ankyrin repeat protein